MVLYKAAKFYKRIYIYIYIYIYRSANTDTYIHTYIHTYTFIHTPTYEDHKISFQTFSVWALLLIVHT